MTIQRPHESASWDDLLTHHAWLQRLARSLVRDPHQADDLAQEVWLRAAHKPPTTTHAPRGWLATVMRRLAIDRGRATTRRRLHETAATESRLRSRRASTSTAALAAQAELHQKVTDAVLALDEPYRSTVLLRYVGDLPIAEVAQQQGVPLETARTRIKRALPRVRSHLDQMYGGARRAWMSALMPLLSARDLALSGATTTGAASTAAAGGWLAMGMKTVIGLGALAAALLTYALIVDDDEPETPLHTTATIASDERAHALSHADAQGSPELEGRAVPPPTPAPTNAAPTAATATPSKSLPAARRAAPGRIGGQIVDGEGKRIEAHVVVEILQNGATKPLPGAQKPLATDDEGWFSLERLAEGSYMVTIHAPGFIGLSAPVQAGAAPRVYELKTAHPIAGTVVEMGTGDPVGGLYVMARSTKSAAGGTTYVGVSTEEGAFRIENLPEGQYVLTVGPPHRLYAQSEWTTREVGVVEGGREDLRVEAVRGLAIAGVIRDADGSPCTETINVEALGRMAHGDPDYARRRRVTSQKDGSFRITGLPAGLYDLAFEPAAKAGEHGAIIAATARKGIRAGSEDLVVDLAAGESIMGRVVNEAGDPVISTGLLYIHPTGTAAGSQESVIVRVDETGAFRSPPFEAARTYRILATSFKGYMQTSVDGVRAGPGEILITLTEAATIRGRLVDEEGKPVPHGVGIVAVAIDGKPGTKGTSSVAYARAGGAFELPGLGPHRFALRGGGGHSAYRAHGSPVEAKPGDTEVIVKVQLGVELSGKLLDADGDPIKTHYLSAHQTGGSGALVPTTRVTNEDGTFTVRGLRAGKVTLRAQIAGEMVDLGEFDAPGTGVEARLSKEP